MKANLPRCQAQTRILHGRYDPYDFEAVRRLWIEAFGDEMLADKAQAASQWLLVRRETDAAKER